MPVVVTLKRARVGKGERVVCGKIDEESTPLPLQNFVREAVLQSLPVPKSGCVSTKRVDFPA
tara:strand:- start:1841 stop:2026 length:186 start_codon:yes stop_codon:yes gene_type:complete